MRDAGTRRAATAAAVCGAVVLALVLGGVGVALPRVLLAGTGERAVAAPSALRSPPAADPGVGSASADRRTAIGAVLGRRGAAVVHDDAAGWRRTQAPGARTPRFDRLAVLPITTWTYDVSSVEPGATSGEVVVDARVHMRLDADTTDAVVHERLTLRQTAATWTVLSEQTADPRAEPWDLGALSVVRGQHSLVIGIDTPASTLRAYAQLADAAVPQVSAVWGTGWSQRPVLVVPRTVGQLAHGLARSTETLEGYAAITTGELTARPGDPPALRVWTNTAGMAELSELGREIVLRHELTHVATDAPGTAGVPLWLEEGFAEYVAYRSSDVALSDELSDLLSAERAGSGPRDLPTQADFQGRQVDVAYEGADLACRLLADRYGQAQLVRLYRDTAAGTGTSEQNLDAALRSLTGSGTEAFETAWRARIRALAA